jgi:hypothetical protein
MDLSEGDREFCTDEELGYGRSRFLFAAGTGFRLDEAYRLAHLPLVAPAHPDVIGARAGTSYRMGRRERVVSLVVPVPGGVLRRSQAYREMDERLRAQSFAGKMAWSVLDERWDKLHVTVCGSLRTGDEPLVIHPDQVEALRTIGPISVELRGLFLGNVNRGRIYLRAYPEKRDGRNLFHRVQEILGCRRTNLYVVGLHNLQDHLDPAETRDLAGFVEQWWDRTILRFTADRLWLLASTDDLVLDSRVEQIITLL